MPDTPHVSLPRVLVIDDEPGLRRMLQFGLAKRGYEVVPAAGGQEAIDAIEKGAFELAVSDIMMPGMDGLEVLQHIKERSPETEVIMATGDATLVTAIEAMKRGAYDYITKPYSLSHLCAIFEKALERRKLRARVAYLEEVDRLKSEFVATMSHELRTPLASTMGFLSLLARGVYGPVTEAQEKALGCASVNSQHLLDLINSVLDFSKLSAHQMTLRTESFSLAGMVQDIEQSMQPLGAAKGITLKSHCPRGVQVKADRLRLRQIVMNLIGNALKFTKAGSVEVEVTLPPDPTQVEIAVRDTGIGIAPEHLPLLFQDFRQIDGSTTREYPGTGLGLSISKRLSILMGGTIEVESTPGHGSTFTVRLPVRVADDIAEPSQPEVSVPPGAKVVLAIDDDEDMLQLLEKTFAGTEFHFVGVRRGDEGLVQARRLHPHSILLDLMMADMDGWTVLKELKADPGLRPIPVYVVSLVEEKAKAFELGATGYVQKPFSREELLKQLSTVPKKSRQVMVVDDSEDVRDMMQKTLSVEGYDVVTVATGEEAIDQLAQLYPDALFLDLMLPGLSGFDVLRALEGRGGALPMAIVVMTAKDLSEDERDFLQRRVSAVFSKGTVALPDVIQVLKRKLIDIVQAA